MTCSSTTQNGKTRIMHCILCSYSWSKTPSPSNRTTKLWSSIWRPSQSNSHCPTLFWSRRSFWFVLQQFDSTIQDPRPVQNWSSEVSRMYFRSLFSLLQCRSAIIVSLVICLKSCAPSVRTSVPMRSSRWCLKRSTPTQRSLPSATFCCGWGLWLLILVLGILLWTRCSIPFWRDLLYVFDACSAHELGSGE